LSTQELSLDELTGFLVEIEDQPPWRTKADREADYIDGNQIDSEILQRMKALGIPPAIEPLMGPVIASVLGMEVKNRADWKVTPETVDDSDDVADAINFKLHQADVRSHADTAWQRCVQVADRCRARVRVCRPGRGPFQIPVQSRGNTSQ
jgi:hypothetical protein